MHCPACGNDLVDLEVDHVSVYDEAMDLYEEAVVRYKSHMDAMAEWEKVGFEGDPPEGFNAEAGLAGWPEWPTKDDFDQSDHLECRNEGCPLHGTYFNLHHPFRGPHSSRGDSFSLSSISGGRRGQALPDLGSIHCPWCGEPMHVHPPPLEDRVLMKLSQVVGFSTWDYHKDDEGHCHNRGCGMRSPVTWGVSVQPGETLTIDWIK